MPKTWFLSANGRGGSKTLDRSRAIREREWIEPFRLAAFTARSGRHTYLFYCLFSTSLSNLTSTALSVISSASTLSSNTEVTLRRDHSYESDYGNIQYEMVYPYVKTFILFL